MNLMSDRAITTSISHNGTLAIFYRDNYYKFHLQLTDVFTTQQAEFDTEDWTAISFYDDEILLMTYEQRFGVACVKTLSTTSIQ